MPSRYLSELIDILKLRFLAARKNLRMAQCRHKKDNDARTLIRERKFDVGDLVYFRNSSTVVGQSKRLLPVWKGPLIDIEIISYRSVAGRNREYVKHHNKLHICEDRDIPLWVRRKRHVALTDGSQNTPTTTVADEDNLLAGVEQLLQTTQSTIEQGIILVPPESRSMWS